MVRERSQTFPHQALLIVPKRQETVFSMDSRREVFVFSFFPPTTCLCRTGEIPGQLQSNSKLVLKGHNIIYSNSNPPGSTIVLCFCSLYIK